MPTHQIDFFANSLYTCSEIDAMLLRNWKSKKRQRVSEIQGFENQGSGGPPAIAGIQHDFQCLWYLCPLLLRFTISSTAMKHSRIPYEGLASSGFKCKSHKFNFVFNMEIWFPPPPPPPWAKMCENPFSDPQPKSVQNKYFKSDNLKILST